MRQVGSVRGAWGAKDAALRGITSRWLELEAMAAAAVPDAEPADVAPGGPASRPRPDRAAVLLLLERPGAVVSALDAGAAIHRARGFCGYGAAAGLDGTRPGCCAHAPADGLRVLQELRDDGLAVLTAQGWVAGGSGRLVRVA